MGWVNVFFGRLKKGGRLVWMKCVWGQNSKNSNIYLLKIFNIFPHKTSNIQIPCPFRNIFWSPLREIAYKSCRIMLAECWSEKLVHRLRMAIMTQYCILLKSMNNYCENVSAVTSLLFISLDANIWIMYIWLVHMNNCN